MPEHPNTSRASGLSLPHGDPAAAAVEALRGLADSGPVAVSAELAEFLADPAGAVPGTSPDPRSDLVTVVRLPIRRASRVAVAAGAALAVAALGGAAVAAGGGAPERVPAQVQQDDPSETTTATETTSAEPTETSSTTAPEESDEAAPARTANPTASANHHDGQGADDEHADVNGGGEVDHRAEHSPTAHPTGPAPEGEGDQADDADDAGEQAGDEAGSRGRP
jgi:hypothetical protein